MSSLFNGDFKTRKQILRRFLLEQNPFRKGSPRHDILDAIFIGRRAELRRAGFAMLDSPRNVLVRGGFGMGKTTFVHKLLSELARAQHINTLTSYHALVGNTPLDVYNTALKGLATAQRDRSERAKVVYEKLMANERFEHPELLFKELLDEANRTYTRVVIAIDELDKHPSRTISELIIQFRPLLDMECSFVLTGKVLDALGTIDSSAYGAFETIIELEPFGKDESREIILRNLNAFRIDGASDELVPFNEAVIDLVVRDAGGIPRAINAICYILIERAVELELESGEPAAINPDFYNQCLSSTGAEIYAASTEKERELIRIMRTHGSYLDMQRNLTEYIAEGFYPDVSTPVMENLTQHDLLLKTETTTNVIYKIAPTVEQFLITEKKFKMTLRQSWAAAIAEGLSSSDKGRLLEDFSVALFERIFKVAARDLRTATEELDVVLEFQGGDSIWAQTPTILVECKNWSSKVPQKEVSALTAKARLDSFDLAFILSVSGFTQDARMQARDYNLAERSQRRLLVLIEGSDVEHFLSDDSDQTTDDFLKSLRRDAQLRKL